MKRLVAVVGLVGLVAAVAGTLLVRRNHPRLFHLWVRPEPQERISLVEQELIE